MSEYAHKPDSKTIHSKSQIESFGSLVHNSAVLAGGHQVIVTHEGYVIPLHVRNGLCYMDMHPASDSDLDQYSVYFLPLIHPGTLTLFVEFWAYHLQFLSSIRQLVGF